MPRSLHGDVSFDGVHALADADFGREMDDAVDAGKRSVQNLRVAHIAHDELGALPVRNLACISAMDLLEKTVEHPHPMPPFEERLREVTPDETSSARD